MRRRKAIEVIYLKFLESQIGDPARRGIEILVGSVWVWQIWTFHSESVCVRVEVYTAQLQVDTLKWFESKWAAYRLMGAFEPLSE